MPQIDSGDPSDDSYDIEPNFPPPSKTTACSVCGIQPEGEERFFEKLIIDEANVEKSIPICNACQFIEDAAHPCHYCLKPVHTQLNGALYKLSETTASYCHHKCHEARKKT